NYLLNVGPKSDGTFPQESIDILKGMGTWMKINSEAIYDTKASPFGLFTWGRCTKKDNGKNTTLYFSVFDWPADGKLTVPGLKNKIVSAKLLANGAKLKTEATNDGTLIHLPATALDPIATVIKVQVQGRVDNGASKPKDKMKTGALD
ncbi:MAG: alpha-L-fucosidase, partial [Chitinophagaceae bacterium]